MTDPAAVQQHFREVEARAEFHETPETLGDLRWSDWLSQSLKHLVSRFHDFKYFGQLSDTARVIVVVITVAAVAGLIALLVRLSRRRREQSAAQHSELPAGQTLLTPQQYEHRLRQALEERDWRGAWLAAWLQFLARLEHRHLVEADRSRTNREYLTQMQAQALPEGVVAQLVCMVDDYDRFIYGRRPIDEAGWAAFRNHIDELSLALGLRERGTEGPA